MPDYVVLIATVGGLALFGLNGFVIGPVIVAMFLAAWQLLAAERLKAAAADEKRRPADAVGDFLRPGGRLSVGPSRAGGAAPSRRRAALQSPAPSVPMDDESSLPSDRIRELEARLVAHGIVLKTIARLPLDTALAELQAAAQSIDDAGMQESNPDLHMRRVAEEMWSILEMVG